MSEREQELEAFIKGLLPSRLRSRLSTDEAMLYLAKHRANMQQLLYEQGETIADNRRAVREAIIVLQRFNQRAQAPAVSKAIERFKDGVPHVWAAEY